MDRDIATETELRPVYVTRSEAVNFHLEQAWDFFDHHLILPEDTLDEIRARVAGDG